jgi:hypothetical protein
MADETSTPEQIEEAAKQGWVDNPEHPKYKTAAEFLEVGSKIAPMQAERIGRLETALEKANRLAEESNRKMSEMQNHLFEDLNKREQAGYDKAMAELNAKQREAVEDRDTEAFDALERQKAQLKKPEKKVPKKAEQPAQVDPEFMAWHQNGNDWYGDKTNPMNIAMSVYADSIKDQCMAGCTTNTQVLEKITAKVKEQFPAQFGGINGGGEDMNNNSAIETGGHKPKRNTGKKDWKSLPKSERDTAEANGYIDRYFGGDKEKFAAKYYEQFQE